jgi:hypothetical protein
MFRKFENIFSQKRLAAGENDNRLPHGSNLIQDFPALLGAQLAGVGASTGRGPAVNAIQIAVPGDFPSHQTRLIPVFLASFHAFTLNPAKQQS